MAFRETDLSYEVRKHPAKATKKIFDAYERAGFRIDKAAELLDVTARTLSRYIATLEIDERIRKARKAYRQKAA